MKLFRLCIFFSLLLAGARANAEADAESKTLYKKATTHFSLGKFKLAAEEYEALYEKHPDQAVLLYNVAQSWRLAGDADKALFFYRRYLANFPNAKNRREVSERITVLERVVAETKKAQEMPPNEPGPTEETKPAEPAPQPAPVAAAPVAAPQKKDRPVYKKWWLWTIVGGVVVVGVAVGLGVGLTRSSGPSSPYADFGPGALTVQF